MISIDDLAFTLWGPFALVLARVLGLAATSPAWGTTGLGWRIRLGLRFLVTMAITPVVSTPLLADLPGTVVALARVLVIEAAIGGMLGMTMALVIAGARQ